MKAGEKNKKKNFSEDLLVLSLDKDGKVTYVNSECERVAGYIKDEIIDRRILDFLIPNKFKNEWRRVFEEVKKDKPISSTNFPLLTKNGHEISASWDIASVDDLENNSLGKIGLVGRINKENFGGPIEKIQYPKDFNDSNSNDKGKVIFKMGNKKITFKSNKSAKKTNSEQIAEKKKNNNNQIIDDTNSETIHGENNNIDILDEYNPDKILDNLKKYDQVISDLKIENEELKNKNDELKNQLEKQKEHHSKVTNNLLNLKKQQNNIVKKTEQILSKSLRFIFDAVGGKKKKEEFDNLIRELDERKNELIELENKFNRDKKVINSSREDFVTWREKLETLENEIEDRRMAVVDKEKELKSRFLQSISQDASIDHGAKDKSISDVLVDVSNDEDILKEIPNSAAVLQRGILKQVNDSFADLLGFKIDDLLEKSFFDFVSPDSLSEVEDYYLKRLKGEAFSSYDAVLVNSDQDELDVKINVKPVIYKGLKADIFVIKNQEDNDLLSGNEKNDFSEEDSED